MKTLDTAKTATLNIVTRKNVTFTMTVKNEAEDGATYECKVYKDDSTELTTLNVAASGLNLIVSHPQVNVATGVYLYTLTRTAGGTHKRILEGSFIVKP